MYVVPPSESVLIFVRTDICPPSEDFSRGVRWAKRRWPPSQVRTLAVS